MSNEPNKPIPAQELSEEELGGIVGGASVVWGATGFRSQDYTSGTSSNDKFITYCFASDVAGDAAALTGSNGLMTLH